MEAWLQQTPSAVCTTTLRNGCRLCFARTATPQYQRVAGLAAAVMKRVICMVLFMGACASRTLAPTAPTASTASTPSIPSFGPQVVSGPYTISGTVTDGNRAVAGANVSAWVQSDR